VNTTSKQSIEIVPAILPADFAELEEKIDLIQGITKSVQVDICDGQFTRVPSWPYKKHDDNFERLQSQEDGLPSWNTLDYEFDLMVNKPEAVVEQWIGVGASRIILHVEAKGDIQKAINLIKGKAEIGLALNMKTDLDTIEPFQNDISVIQLMAIDVIGFQGQQFNEGIVEKIKAAKHRYTSLPISIDGGVTINNAPRLIEAGADRLIVGSAIFGSDNPIDAIGKFKRVTR